MPRRSAYAGKHPGTFFVSLWFSTVSVSRKEWIKHRIKYITEGVFCQGFKGTFLSFSVKKTGKNNVWQRGKTKAFLGFCRRAGNGTFKT